MTRAEFSIALTRALHSVVLSHPVYAVLVVCKSGQARTIAGASAALGISYHSVVWHLRKYPDLFWIDKESVPHGIRISAEGEQLLHKIETLVARYAEDDAASRCPQPAYRDPRPVPA